MTIARSILLAIGLVAAPAGMLGTPSVAAAEVPRVERLGMVDLQAILTATAHGKRSKAKLEKELKTRQQQLDKKRGQLESEVAKLPDLKGAALQEAQQRLQQESVQWQQDAMQAETDLAQKEATMLEEVYTNVQTIVKKIAKEQGLDLVLVRDQMTVLYVEGSLDITADVISRYEKAYK